MRSLRGCDKRRRLGIASSVEGNFKSRGVCWSYPLSMNSGSKPYIVSCIYGLGHISVIPLLRLFGKREREIIECVPPLLFLFLSPFSTLYTVLRPSLSYFFFPGHSIISTLRYVTLRANMACPCPYGTEYTTSTVRTSRVTHTEYVYYLFSN